MLVRSTIILGNYNFNLTRRVFPRYNITIKALIRFFRGKMFFQGSSNSRKAPIPC